MGRPKNSNSDAARKQIQAAFWDLLDREGYEKITINKVAKEAHVNRNSVYYHYENILDLAEKSFLENIHSEQGVGLVTAALNQFTSENAYILDEKTRECMKKLQLMAGSNSIELHQMLKRGIKDNWFHIMQVNEDILSEIDRLSVDMAFHTATYIMGTVSFADNPEDFKSILETDIGRAIVKTMRDIQDKYHTG